MAWGVVSVIIRCTACFLALQVLMPLSVRGIMCLERQSAAFLLPRQYFNWKFNSHGRSAMGIVKERWQRLVISFNDE